MAAALDISSHWWHRDHFDVPMRRKSQIETFCVKVSPKQIVLVIRGKLTYDDIVSYVKENPSHVGDRVSHDLRRAAGLC